MQSRRGGELHPLNQTTAELFWEKVNKRGEEPDDCWEWTASGSDNGYGRLRDRQRRSVLAHRYSWELHHGEAPTGMVLHRCDNRSCVRPSHLFLGTQADNMADMVAKGRHVQGARRPPLSAAERAALLADLVAGMPRKEVARRHGVTYHTVWRRAKDLELNRMPVVPR